jgi:hypothetical protein
MFQNNTNGRLTHGHDDIVGGVAGCLQLGKG